MSEEPMSENSRSVLIVDDDESIRNTLRLALEFEGYQVETAGNGEEALQVMRGIAPPSLILLDLMMPVMDGWDFAEALRNDPHLAKPPIVVVTAFAEKADTFHGAASVLTKPIDLDSLFDVIRESGMPPQRKSA